MALRPFRWLHLSDLHLGCRGEELWWQVREEFEHSIRAEVQRAGAPDLLLLSGDLTFRGARGEFDQFDRFLDVLLGWLLEETGATEPALFAVPGNHDLARPTGATRLGFGFLDQYLARTEATPREVEDLFWGKEADVSHIAPLFAEYSAWLERRVAPSLAARAAWLNRSAFPGDLCAEIAPVGAVPVLLVGLNSTWLQYREGEDFEGRMFLPARQFQAALPREDGGSPLAVFRQDRPALLVMHHPPGWLSEAGRDAFHDAIYPAHRFSACLYGHLHRARSESTAISGGQPRFYFQSPSLFGLERYGTAIEERRMGYSWGEVSVAGEVQVWPLRLWKRESGSTFIADPDFAEPAQGARGARAGAMVDRTARLDTRVAVSSFQERNREPAAVQQYGHSQPRIRYKVFVSYAQVNNGSGWVSRFVEILQKRLPDVLKVRAECQIWMDESGISPSEPFPAKIRAEVKSADIYLAIISYGYFNSMWCQEEREIFLDTWGKEAEGRLFLIHYQPVDQEEVVWPQEFSGLGGFTFYQQEAGEASPPALLGEEPQHLEQTYLVLVRNVAWEIAKKLNQIEKARKFIPLKEGSVEVTPALSVINAAIVAPRDLIHEGQLLRKRLPEIAKLNVAGGDVAIVPATLSNLLAVDEHWNPISNSLQGVMVVLVWSELGDEKGPANELGPLVERAYRIARERNISILLYRCNRELSFRPDDPGWELKILNFKKVDQFFSLFQDSLDDEKTILHVFQTVDDLVTRFEGDLKELVSRMVERSTHEAHLLSPRASSEPSAEAANLEDVLHAYLHWVVKKHERLELRGIGGTASLASIPLEDVYVALRGVRATEQERQQSRSLFQAELFSLVRALPEGISALEFAQLVEEAETRAVIDNPLMPSLVDRDRMTPSGATQPTEVTMSLGEAFRTERWLVVLGDPGSGKTTLLRWIARKLAMAMIADPDRHLDVPAYQVDPTASRDDVRKMVNLGPPRLPVLVRVSEYADALLKARKNGQTLPLIDFLGTHTWQGEKSDIEANRLNLLIRTFLQQGRAVALLDGMDEVTASSHRDEVVHAIEAFIEDWVNLRGDNRHLGTRVASWTTHGVPWEQGGNQILITSRIAGYHASPIAGSISHMTVQPMQRRAVEHFCDAWTLAVYQQSFPSQEDVAIRDAKLESTRLKSEIFNPQSPQVWELASNPLMITILALIFRKKQGQLPRQRSELYQTALEILIENWRFAGITTDEFIYVLSPLAARVHGKYSTGLIPEGEMREIITQELARYHNESPEDPPPRFVREVKSFIRHVREDVGLLAERSATGKLYGFLHLTFQEYLAGLYLVRDRASAGQAIVDRLDDPRWREPILLALGYVSSSPNWGPTARGKLLRQILDADDPLGGLLPRGPLLVIRALREMDNVPDELVGELLDRLLRAYMISANDEASSALARQIEKAIDTVYKSSHQNQVVGNLVRILTRAAPSNMDQAMACASLVRANGWRHPEFVQPLLRCQPYDDSKWSLPITEILRWFVTPPTPFPDFPKMERSIEELRQNLEAVRNGSKERSLREEIAAFKKRLTELMEEQHG